MKTIQNDLFRMTILGCVMNAEYMMSTWMSLVPDLLLSNYLTRVCSISCKKQRESNSVLGIFFRQKEKIKGKAKETSTTHWVASQLIPNQINSLFLRNIRFLKISFFISLI